MTSTTHRYSTSLAWTGNTGAGTAGYRAYSRSHDVRAAGKPPIAMSSDPHFRGDPSRLNPEELFVASLSSCHMLWYLHLCADAGVVVVAYEDDAIGTITVDHNGDGMFTEVVLRPAVTVAANSDRETARRLHDDAHHRCFIAKSVSVPVRHEPVITAAP